MTLLNPLMGTLQSVAAVSLRLFKLAPAGFRLPVAAAPGEVRAGHWQALVKRSILYRWPPHWHSWVRGRVVRRTSRRGGGGGLPHLESSHPG